MGKGIVTNSGADPLEVWGNRIDNFDSGDLSAALRTLMAGGQLTCKDGVLEVSALPDAHPGRHRITIRIPDAPYVADVIMTAIQAYECPHPDPRSSTPSPDRWMTLSTSGKRVTWEWFNCKIHTLKSRPN